MNISSKNKVVLILALALSVGLTFNGFNEELNSAPLKFEPSTNSYQALDNQPKLSEDSHEIADELNIAVAKLSSTTNKNSPSCDITNNVLPVRLTISKGNQIKIFGKHISEDYLFKTLEKRSYDCESIKLYFSLEDGVTDNYLNQLITKIDKLEVTQVYRPAILHSPPLRSHL